MPAVFASCITTVIGRGRSFTHNGIGRASLAVCMIVMSRLLVLAIAASTSPGIGMAARWTLRSK